MTQAKKTTKGTPAAKSAEVPCQEDLRIASEILTLHHLLWNELAMTNTWAAPSSSWPPTVPDAFPPAWPVPTASGW